MRKKRKTFLCRVINTKDNNGPASKEKNHMKTATGKWISIKRHIKRQIIL